jgi:hypothetical protein
MSMLRAQRLTGAVGDMKIDGRGRLRIRFTTQDGRITNQAGRPCLSEAGEVMTARRRRALGI